MKPPAEIVEQLGGTCPRCGQKLKFNPNDVEVKMSKKEEPRR